jgi:tRNA G18 (ribose-2'-O)-methylase SpoU
MPIIRITDPADPRTADYRNVPDPDLLRRGGLFVAENRLVVRALLASRRFRTRSLLLTEPALDNLDDLLQARRDGDAPAIERIPVYVCPKALMEPIAGYNIHRGCLAIGERPPALTVEALLGAGRDVPRLTRPDTGGRSIIVALEALTNADNVGGIFRSAAAFGVDAIVVGPRCCDPLYRKAIRVSIGASLRVPFAHAVAWPEDVEHLRRAGYIVVALTPSPDAIDLDAFAQGAVPPKVALLIGNEGDGLSAAIQASADVRVRIAMTPGEDSLNAAAAAAIALHSLWRA